MYSDELRNDIQKLIKLYNRITYDFNKGKQPEEWYPYLELNMSNEKPDSV